MNSGCVVIMIYGEYTRYVVFHGALALTLDGLGQSRMSVNLNHHADRHAALRHSHYTADGVPLRPELYKMFLQAMVNKDRAAEEKNPQGNMVTVLWSLP
jgi:hypothetical protein